MSLNLVIKEVNAIKEGLSQDSSTDGTPQWKPSFKNEFALTDEFAFSTAGSSDPNAIAPQVATAAPVETETTETSETTETAP